MLQVAHLSARYKDKPALEDINLTIKPGEFMVILGPSGCGKTTLLNLIAGFITDYTGDISLNGKRVTAPGVERGVVFQDEGLLPWRTVLDNVAFGLQLAGINRSTRTKRAHELLVQVGLTDKAASFIWQLSGGQRQRVGIARALAAAPQLLLLDEPFGALDAFTREQMQTLLLQLWHDNRGQVLLITHDIEEALFLATELVLLSPGPGRVMEKIALNYGRRFLKGETCRHIKSAPEFIAQREYILHQLYAQREVQQ